MAESSPAKAFPSEKKVMLIDDDDTILQMLKATFSVEGFQVRTGCDARNILEKVAGFRPDLIVTDLMMPGGGGYELLRILQSDEATRGIPVIVITGHEMDGSTKKLMEQEPNLAGYFKKPVRGDRLVKEAHRLLNTLTPDEQERQRKDAWGEEPDLPDFNKL